MSTFEQSVPIFNVRCSAHSWFRLSYLCKQLRLSFYAREKEDENAGPLLSVPEHVGFEHVGSGAEFVTSLVFATTSRPDAVVAPVFATWNGPAQATAHQQEGVQKRASSETPRLLPWHIMVKC